MQYSRELLFDGKARAIYAIRCRGRCEFIDFLEKLEREDQGSYDNIIAMLRRIAMYGPAQNEQQFRKCKDSDVYEIKSGRIRLFCFYAPKSQRLLLISHGWSKGLRKEQNQEIQRAQRIYNDYRQQI